MLLEEGTVVFTKYWSGEQQSWTIIEVLRDGYAIVQSNTDSTNAYNKKGRLIEVLNDKWMVSQEYTWIDVTGYESKEEAMLRKLVCQGT